jgi:hypothetical protein
MKRGTLLLFLPALMACLAGCASTRGYLVDRGRDAADILTATAGAGAGVQARLGPAALGFLQTSDAAGLRHGEAFHRPPAEDPPDELNYTLGSLLGWVSSPALVFIAGLGGGVLPPGYWDQCAELWRYERQDRMSETQVRRHAGAKGWRAAGSYQIETALGVGLVARAGINPGELLDFLLGWTTVDIFNDDVEARKRKEVQLAGAPAAPGGLPPDPSATPIR